MAGRCPRVSENECHLLRSSADDAQFISCNEPRMGSTSRPNAMVPVIQFANPTLTVKSLLKIRRTAALSSSVSRLASH